MQAETLSLPLNQVLCNHVLTVLKSFPEDSIDLVMTSPPYWGLRDYSSVESKTFSVESRKEAEDWLEERFKYWSQNYPHTKYSKKIDEKADAKSGEKYLQATVSMELVDPLGLEPTFQLYIDHLLEIFGEVKRVLKPTGSFYLNIGDTYSGSGQGHKSEQFLNPNNPFGQKFSYKTSTPADYFVTKNRPTSNIKDIPSKSLCGIPWRIALRMVDDGWIWRNNIIWYKPNHMPSSVKDRLSNSWEPIFHFVKQKKYYYNLDAIRVPHTVCGVTDKRPMGILRQKLYNGSRYNKSDDPHLAQYQGKFEGYGQESEKYGSPRARTQRKQDNVPRPNHATYEGFNDRWREKQKENKWSNSESELVEFFREKGSGGHYDYGGINSPEGGHNHPLGKNPGDFWRVTTEPHKDAHFAIFPLGICWNPILSSCPKDGVVMDIFSGIGTVAEATELLNRFGKAPTKHQIKLARIHVYQQPAGWWSFQAPLMRMANRKWIMVDINPAYRESSRERLAIYGK